MLPPTTTGATRTVLGPMASPEIVNWKFDERNAFAAARRLPDEAELRRGLDQLDHALAKQRVVVDDQDGLGVWRRHVFQLS